MAGLYTQSIKVVARFVFALLLLVSAVLAPAHAASMTVAEISPEVHSTALPCPMSGMMASHHADVGNPVQNAPASMDHACCLAPALETGIGNLEPIRIFTATEVEPIRDVRIALSTPPVDLQPPRL